MNRPAERVVLVGASDKPERYAHQALLELRAHGHSVVHPWVVGLAEADVRTAHAAGVAVNTWTCNDPGQIAELLAWGVDGICTDVPDVAVAARAAAMPGG